MTYLPLRAKSWSDEQYDAAPPNVLLSRHLADVFSSAQRVVEATADDQLLALGLPPEEYRKRLQRCVLLAAALHDLGKANDHFQGMIYRSRDLRVNPQGVRHEWVTLLMLRHLREWLLPAMKDTPRDFSFVEWAIVGHHPAPNHASPPRDCPPGAGVEIEFLMGEPEFEAALEFLRSAFSLTKAPQFANTKRNLVGADNVFVEFASWSRASQRIWDEVRSQSVSVENASPRVVPTSHGASSLHRNRTGIRSDRQLVAAIKNCLIAADIAGSVLPKAFDHEPDRASWIMRSFAARPERGDLQTIVDHRLGKNTVRPFQQSVAVSPGAITFVKAGCGSGKTLAAYMWAAANHPTRRLYFCYPTTGTATEGFKDYLFDDAEKTPRVGAKLFHSRRDVDFEIILEAGNDTLRPNDDIPKRLEALESWSTPIVTCTVDTVLGLVQNNKRGLFAWPALAQSAFVFDEIHAFDDRLFGALLRFLRDLPGLPVLLMTASLPASRENALQSLLESRGQQLSPIAGPPELEDLPRYRQETSIASDPMLAVHGTLAKRGKVLWVCNTVSRVMDAATRATGCSPLLYHSRFKYEDRVARHKAVIDAFNPKLNPGKALAICSQVAEMSLDLSADLLVTDLATVPALIQRLGRLNRRAEQGDPTKPFVVVEPDNHLPYTTVNLAAARQWLARLPLNDISQRHLAEAWEQTDDQLPELVASAWLDGGPVTTVSELREASPGITVLMEEDHAEVRRDPQMLPRRVLPMPSPRSLKWQSWPRERGIPVAPPGSIQYDELRGAQWQRKE